MKKYLWWITACVMLELFGVFFDHGVIAEASVVSMATACALMWIGYPNGRKR